MVASRSADSTAADALRRNIIRLCSERGWNRSELATRTGKSRSQISKILNGDTAFNEIWIDLFAEAFGVAPRDLWPLPQSADTGDQRNFVMLGAVGTGGRVVRSPVSPLLPGSFGEQDLPSFLPGRSDYVVAVVDDAVDMYPLEKGWRLFFLPASLGLCLGKTCLVTLRSGESLVKRVRNSTDGTIDLEHFNPMIAPIREVQIERSYLLAGIDAGFES